MTRVTTDVLIVGAGPCGLMLANELGRRGIAAMVVDREPTVATAPQANATQARTMEHYRRLGFAAEIRALGLPAHHATDVAYYTTFAGHELARHQMPASGEADRVVREQAHLWNGAELPHRIPQSLVEQTLCQQAQALPDIEIAFNTELTGFVEDDAGVLAEVRTAAGQSYRIRARYLFAADGGSSMVRKQLGIRYAGGDAKARDFMGGQMLSIYLDAPAFYELNLPRAWMYWTFNRRRRALLATVDGTGGFVLQTQLREGEDAATMTQAEAGELFLQAVGKEIPYRLTGIATWLAGRALVAERFCHGRVFLGGDAVHLFTPTGGMGYNTAIEDAVNIGWKLAAVLKGQAGEGLLASYEAERRPVALRNTRFAIEFADSVGLYVPSPAIEDSGAVGEAARARAGAYLQQHAAREFTIPGFTFGARYDASPVISAERSPAPPDAASVYVPSAKPGGRAPHAWLSDGRSLFDAFGFEWTLLCLGEDSDAAGDFLVAAEARGMTLKILYLPQEVLLPDLYEAPYALIRPDQIVAWRGAAPGTRAISTLFDKLTARAAVRAVADVA
ncbi:FAD-dependent monooxygenase [Tritonibacter horizontis]|uniref:2,4-dichlorophenol 6-monooxygenase n=1 Tax=Tritonibacter horizontis TaxID=1768241 RepID=A0A132BQT6_9RHOB|nr:FAD-dependent monooxygenase [Tritonibacter horizontis]KUP90769.1 2,4-dichlorophenol 6-monooxygenase [Tritonibacter horizontis]